MIAQNAAFDRDPALGELLRGVPAAKLEATLGKTLGQYWQIIELDGRRVLGPGIPADHAATAQAPLCLEIEPIGHLQASGPVSHQNIAALGSWLELVLTGAHRYRMAADLHLEAVHADYETLQAKHAALQESEARYRDLSAQLEQRVEAQIKVIERTQRQLYQTEKMASVGSLAAGMAHEINNPIGFIRSNLNAAMDYLGRIQHVLTTFHQGDFARGEAAWNKYDIDFLLQDFAGLLAESSSGADRVARIVSNLKSYAAIDCSSTAPLDLNESLQNVIDSLHAQLPGGVTLELDLRPLPTLICDQSRINQMLFALIQNARLAVLDGGRIRVSTACGGDDVVITIGDDGVGIAPDILQRVFDPFFTTRDVGKGMGLGLTVSRDIVTAHGGSIAIESKIGHGTCITVRLPLRPVPEAAP